MRSPPYCYHQILTAQDDGHTPICTFRRVHNGRDGVKIPKKLRKHHLSGPLLKHTKEMTGLSILVALSNCIKCCILKCFKKEEISDRLNGEF